MRSVRQLVYPLILASTLATVACGNAPEKEMQQAQGALEAARAAGADEYAHDEFAAAEDALKRAQQAVDDRDYRLALNNALDSRERAKTAAREAADRKATARTDADRAITGAVSALGDARDKLKKAETARAAPRTLVHPREVISGADQEVQEARAAFQNGNYLGMPEALADVVARLRAVAQDLDAAAAPAPPRRRR